MQKKILNSTITHDVKDSYIGKSLKDLYIGPGNLCSYFNQSAGMGR